MQCIGRTTTGMRCKNNADITFCRHHRWQPWVLLVSILSFSAVIAGLYQDVWKSITHKEQTIPVIRDESYAVARALLIRSGWIPQSNHWSHGDTVDIRSGNGPDLWDKDYHELDYCSGTGYALCRFEFNDPNGNLLVVITRGESYDGNIDRVKVFRVTLNPEKEQGAYGDTLGIKETTVEEFRKALRAVRSQNE